MILREVPCYLRTVMASSCIQTTSERLDEGMEDQQHRPVGEKLSLNHLYLLSFFSTHRKSSIVESVILISFEEVRVAVGVLKGGVDIVGNSLPVADWLRVCCLDWWSLERIESPELTSLVEVNLSISTPNHCCVDIIRHACKTFVDLLRVISVKITSIISPVLWILEEVSLSVLVCEGSIDVAWKTRPAFRDFFGVAIGNRVLRQFVILVASESVGRTVGCIENGVDLRISTKLIIISRRCWSFRRFSWRSRWSRAEASARCLLTVECLNSLWNKRLTLCKTWIMCNSLEYHQSPIEKLGRIHDRTAPSMHFARLNDSIPMNVQIRELFKVTDNQELNSSIEKFNYEPATWKRFVPRALLTDHCSASSKWASPP